MCALIAGNTLHVAWLGDSQVLLVQQGQAVKLMEPHRPERQVRGPILPGGSRRSSRGGCPAPVGPLKLGVLAARNLTEPFLSQRHGAQSCRTELGICWQVAQEAGLTRRRGAPGGGEASGGEASGGGGARSELGGAEPGAAGREEALGMRTHADPAAGCRRPGRVREQELPLRLQDPLGREPGSSQNGGASRGRAGGRVTGRLSGSSGEGLPVKARGAKRKGMGFKDAKSGRPWHPGGRPCLWPEALELLVGCSLGVWGLEGLQDTHTHL